MISNRRRRTSASSEGTTRKQKIRLQLDEDIASVSSQGEMEGSDVDSAEDDKESAEQKRLRLARDYLLTINKTNNDDEDEDDNEDDEGADDYGPTAYEATSIKLSRSRLDAEGKLFRNVAAQVDCTYVATNCLSLSGHKASVTAVALSSDSSKVFSGSKDNSVISWDVETGARTTVKRPWSRKLDPSTQQHQGEVLAVASPSNSHLVISGGNDCKIRIFDVRIGSEVKVLDGHRGPVTALVAPVSGSQLYSGSADRTIKIWDLNAMAYVETLFGHQESVNAIDCWSKEEPIAASKDRTMRVFKVAQDNHLVFRGHKSSVDAVQYLTQSSYISGGQDGSLCLWREANKKPVRTLKEAHGVEGLSPRWIVSAASLKMTDLAVSGSYDGLLRLWSASAEAAVLCDVGTVPLDGFVNSLAVSSKILVAGTGNEHKFGRWWNIKGNHNKVTIYKVPSLGGDV